VRDGNQIVSREVVKVERERQSEFREDDQMRNVFDIAILMKGASMRTEIDQRES
jgi:hypothetical protein